MVLYMSYQRRLHPNLHMETDSQIKQPSGRWGQRTAYTKAPNITDILAELKLGHRVTPVFAHRSYTWELQKMLRARPRPVFDLCYLDGGHSWDVSALGVFLADRLIRPGGLLVLDDLDWSIATSPAFQEGPETLGQFSSDEQQAKPVRLLWEEVLPDLGYSHFAIHPNLGWAIARKRDTKAVVPAD